MTRPTILDNENVALLDLTPSGREKPAWAIAAEREVGRQMASLTASVMRRAGDCETTAWDDVRKYVEGLETEVERLKNELGDPDGVIAHADSITKLSESRIAELEKRLADAERVIEPFAYEATSIEQNYLETLTDYFTGAYNSIPLGVFRAARAYMEGK